MPRHNTITKNKAPEKLPSVREGKPQLTTMQAKLGGMTVSQARSGQTVIALAGAHLKKTGNMNVFDHARVFAFDIVFNEKNTAEFNACKQKMASTVQIEASLQHDGMRYLAMPEGKQKQRVREKLQARLVSEYSRIMANYEGLRNAISNPARWSNNITSLWRRRDNPRLRVPLAEVRRWYSNEEFHHKRAVDFHRARLIELCYDIEVACYQSVQFLRNVTQSNDLGAAIGGSVEKEYYEMIQSMENRLGKPDKNPGLPADWVRAEVGKFHAPRE